MEFLKSNQLSLNEGKYLIGAEGKPVTNDVYVAEQLQAHYLVTLAAKCKGKTFKAEKVASFAALVAETQAEVTATAATTYFEKKAAPKSKTLDALVEAALAFQGVATDNQRVEKLNAMLQQFNNINKVDNFGMYFTAGIVELPKIYTITDIKAAAEVIVDVE